MESFSLVLTGEIIGDSDDAAVMERLAGAFGMDAATFRAKVWQRAPLIIRQSLDHAMAQEQAAQLVSLGATAMALPESPSLVWLLRDGRILGPLPEPALPELARVGDQWCHDGDSRWHCTPGTPLPPPLPTRQITPPPLPEQSAAAPRRRRATPWLAGGLATVALLIVAWRHDRPPPPAPVQTVRYIPRPLQPLAATHAAGHPSCRDAGAAPGGDEDRFLIAGGQRQLTGRSDRSGDTYVAEAVLGRDARCQATSVQLYVFRHGAFVGTAMEAPIDPRRNPLVSFRLADDRTLDYTLGQCESGTTPCPPDEDHHAMLQPGGGGWIMARESERPVAGVVEIIRRQAPRYPAEAIRQRHEGTVMLLLTIGADGLPREITVEQSSGYAELDQAAVESARQWRFKAFKTSGATTARAHIPVHFHLARAS